MSSYSYCERHIGPSEADIGSMLQLLGLQSTEELIKKAIPASIISDKKLNLPPTISEAEFMAHMDELASKNGSHKSFIGLGYYNTHLPAVIRRNILENPGWYTQYTPYQAEISQGRLEALLNFQTMIADLTGMEVANASLLDEATAAAEAMTMCYRIINKNSKTPRKKVAVSDVLFPVNIELLQSRAELLDIEIVPIDIKSAEPDESYFCAFFQYPALNGQVEDYSDTIQRWKSAGCMTVMICDILSLALLKSPAECGADVAVGNTQRFGVPMFYGGPHAAYFATSKAYVRNMPGRIIGISKDTEGNIAYRMTLQTREQHIKRDKATSNICTAQALLAIMSAMYGIYHGSKGIRNIAETVYNQTSLLAEKFSASNVKVINSTWFDTLTVQGNPEDIRKRASEVKYNLYYHAGGTVSFSLDETVTDQDLSALYYIITGQRTDIKTQEKNYPANYPKRTTKYLTHAVFNRYRSETEMMRYIKRLELKDLSLTGSMIPLGSCTMKLNPAATMIPLTHPQLANVHPFVPLDQTKGYAELITNLENYLANITGFDGMSLQPNSGAQGEYAGLKAIRNYYIQKGEPDRNLALILESAHGTNFASAALCGMDIVIVKTDRDGNIDMDDLIEKTEKNAAILAVIMITYPSTHGVFEAEIKTICDIVHKHGGNVYIDGANMNAQVGITSPAIIGADVCHLNLHKTFSIPHGGGGPGMGPIGVKSHLIPFLPNHPIIPINKNAIKAVSAAPWGSAGILAISYGYIRMLGEEGCRKNTEVAILNANYLRKRLEKDYHVLFSNENGYNAHEFIIDLKPFRDSANVEVTDVAKRLIDYSFHAPTVSFPVSGTLMIEPTESESKEELDRFCDAMLAIRAEIQEIVDGKADKQNNVLKNAPHTLSQATGDTWDHPYSRDKAAYPVKNLRSYKFWTNTSRIDEVYGDRNICSVLEE